MPSNKRRKKSGKRRSLVDEPSPPQEEETNSVSNGNDEAEQRDSGDDSDDAEKEISSQIDFSKVQLPPQIPRDANGKPKLTRRQWKKLKQVLEEQQRLEQDRVELEEAEIAQREAEDAAIDNAPINWRRVLWWLGVIAAVVGSMVILRMNQEQYAWTGLERDDNAGDQTSHYEILEIKSTATQSEIRKAYRKAAQHWHPDRNKDCGRECDVMMAKISKAYETLSNTRRREIYDNTHGGSVSEIPTMSVEITYENFKEKVIMQRGLVIVQVYAEQYKACHRFSTIWEDAVRRMGEYVTFGRIHADRQISLIRRLGTAVRDYPTVIAFVNGRLRRQYPHIETPAELYDLIAEDFPKRHVWIANEETMAKRIDRRHRMTKPKPLDLIMIASKKIEPSMLLLNLAFKYDGILQFAHIYPRSAVKAGIRKPGESGPKKSAGSVRRLSRVLTESFLLPEIKKLPQLIVIAPDGTAELSSEKVSSKPTLLSFVRRFAANRTIPLNTYTYSTICQSEHDIVCVALLKGCDSVGSSAIHYSTEQMKLMMKEDLKMNAHFDRIAEYSIDKWQGLGMDFDPKWIQFVKIDVTQDDSKALKSICPASLSESGSSTDSANNNNARFQLVAIREAATELLQYSKVLPEELDEWFNLDEDDSSEDDESDESLLSTMDELQSEEYRRQVSLMKKGDLWKWIECVLKQETIGTVDELPYIRHPPPKQESMLNDLQEFFEEFELSDLWYDENMRLNVIFITIFVGGFFVLKNLGCKGFVMFVFALSIFGGLFQIMFMMGSGGLDSGNPRARPKRTRGRRRR